MLLSDTNRDYKIKKKQTNTHEEISQVIEK